jgi:peptide/nickel transport system permease protein
VPFAAGLWPNLKSIILPALSLGLALNAVTMRQVRASLIEVMGEDYITVARAKGVSEGAVIRVHALKNAMIPVITVIGLQVGRLFGGTVVVETIFAFPGMGRLAADSIFFRDFPALQGVVLVMALAVLVCNLLTDMLYAYVDPRIRYA